MNGDIPTLPAGDRPPSFADMAVVLAGAFPDADRAAAIQLLVDKILPWDLRGMPTHPNPRAVAQVGYAALARLLGEVERGARLDRLQEIAADRRGDQLVGRAISLAVARYIHDRGRPRTREVDGYLEDAGTYLAMTTEQILDEAKIVETALDEWEQENGLRHLPSLERHRVALIHARHALGNARSGRFDVAMGVLAAFLRQVGQKPRRLDPH